MGRGPGVRAATKASIQIDFRYKGARYRERIRLAPTPANLKYAARLKATIEHEIATNTFDYAKHFPDSPRAQKHSGPSGPALRTALLDYCDSLDGQLQPETLDEYRHDAELVAAGLGATKPLYSIKRSDVREWIKTLNLTKKRINNLLIPVRGAFNQAVEDEAIDASPLAGFKVRKVEAPREDAIDPFTPEEIAALGKQSLGDLWTFWAWSGPRSGEIIGFQWQDVTEDYSRIRVRRAVRVGREKVTKTHAGRRWIDLLAACPSSSQAHDTRRAYRSRFFAIPTPASVGTRTADSHVRSDAIARLLACATVIPTNYAIRSRRGRYRRERIPSGLPCRWGTKTC
jgi:integrase